MCKIFSVCQLRKPRSVFSEISKNKFHKGLKKLLQKILSKDNPESFRNIWDYHYLTNSEVMVGKILWKSVTGLSCISRLPHLILNQLRYTHQQQKVQQSSVGKEYSTEAATCLV